ncbi:hypothetical protein ES706_06654 [subsurface metagenome]
MFGDESQTRSFIYVVDEVEGLLKAFHYDATNGEVINLGDDNELTILELAKLIIELINSNSIISF